MSGHLSDKPRISKKSALGGAIELRRKVAPTAETRPWALGEAEERRLRKEPIYKVPSRREH